jgi:hypothetical protein
MVIPPRSCQVYLKLVFIAAGWLFLLTTLPPLKPVGSAKAIIVCLKGGKTSKEGAGQQG